MTNTDATTSYLQNCVDAKDDELYRVKGVRNELQDKCNALAAKNAALRAALTAIAGLAEWQAQTVGTENVDGGLVAVALNELASQARAALGVK